MSFRKRKLVIAEDAQQDIRSLLLFSEEQWGSRQRDRYQAELNRAFELIRSNPMIGPSREDLGQTVRIRIVERHIIHYRLEGEIVRVLRVVHQRVDPDLWRFENPKEE